MSYTVTKLSFFFRRFLCTKKPMGRGLCLFPNKRVRQRSPLFIDDWFRGRRRSPPPLRHLYYIMRPVSDGEPCPSFPWIWPCNIHVPERVLPVPGGFPVYPVKFRPDMGIVSIHPFHCRCKFLFKCPVHVYTSFWLVPVHSMHHTKLSGK